MKPILITLTLWFWAVAATAQIAPTGFGATAAAFNQIDLKWTHNGLLVDEFVIERSDGNKTSYKPLATVLQSAKANQEYSDKTVSGSTIYYYRIATKLGTRSSPWVEANATTPANPTPATPNGLVVANSTTGTFSVRWNLVAGAEGYEVRLSTKSDFTTDLKTGATTKTDFTFGDLAPDRTYFVQVRAKNTVGTTTYWSDWSETRSGKTDPIPLVAPTNVRGDGQSPTQVNVFWDHNGANVSKFTISRSEQANTGPWVVAGEAGATAKTFTDNGVLGNKGYFYQVCAVSPAGQSACGVSAVGVNTPNYASASRLQLTIEADGRGMNATWTAPANAGPTGYQVQISTNSDFPGGTPTQTTTQLSQKLPGLTPCTGYFVRVRATYPNGGVSDYINSTRIVTEPTIPTKLTTLSATASSSSQINLSFQYNSNTEAGFDLEYATNSSYTNATKKALDRTSRAEQVTGLTASTRYWFRVRATTCAKPSDWTETDATTQAPPVTKPNPPTNVVATVKTATQVDLSWTDGGGGANEFEIQRAEGAGAFAKISTLAASKLSTSDNGVQLGKMYSYRINAINAGGSALSETKTVTMPIAPPQAGYTLTVLSSSQIRVDASGSAGATTLELQHARDDKFTVGLGGQNIPAAGGSVTIGDLPASTRHYFRLRATNTTFGLSSDWSVKEATTLPNAPQPPAAPTNLIAVALSDSEISLNWTDNSDETGFEVERSPDGTTGWTNVGTTAANVNTFRNGGLTAQTRYVYRVRSARGGLFSAYTNPVGATTHNTPVVVPAAPANLVATVASSSQINLSWNAANGLTGYKLEYADNVAFTNQKTETNILGTATTFAVQNLLANTPYYFRLYAVNSAGTSPAATADARTATAPITKPNPPTGLNLTGAADGKQIAVTWTDASDNETRFDIQYAETADFANSTLATVGAGVGTFTISNLQPCRTYFVRVSAANSAGNSAWIDGKLTLNPTVPGKAANLAGTAASQTQVDLVWTYTTNTEDAFELEYAENSSYTNSTKRDLAKANRTENVTGLKVATPYWLRIRAKNCGGNGDWTESTATTLNTPVVAPAAPTNLSVRATVATQLEVKWTDNASNEEAYELQYSTDATFATSTVQVRLGAGESTTNLTGLAAGTTYSVRVRAVNKAGESAWLTGSGATLPATPSTLQAPVNLRFASSVPVFNQLSLLWTDVATNETGYEVWRSVNDQTNWVRVAEMAVNSSAYIDNGLRSGVAYFYRVRAVQNTAFSDW